MDLSDRSKCLEKVYSARNNEELEEGYDAWAKDYDLDVLSFGYKIPAIMTLSDANRVFAYRVS